MPDLSLRKAAKLLRKFRIADGDVILVKNDTDLSSEENMRVLAGALKIIGHKHTILLIVDEFDNIKTVSEERMNKYGWFRINTLREIIHRAAEEQEVESSD